MQTTLKDALGEIAPALARKRQAAQEALRSAITTAGDSLSAAATLYPRLLEGQRPEAILEDWAWDYAGAEDLLSQECPQCQGRRTEGCLRPRILADGRLEWAPCPLQTAWVRQQRAATLLGEANLEARFRRRTLDRFEARDASSADALGAVRRWLDRWGQPEMRGLLITGPNGSGKTHLAAAIVQALCERGVAARFYTAKGLHGLLMQEMRAGRLERTQRLLVELPLLAVDDLGKEYIPDKTRAATYDTEAQAWWTSQWFELVNARYEADRPLVITSNLSEEQIRQRYGEAVYSRFGEMLDALVLDSPDYRWRED